MIGSRFSVTRKEMRYIFCQLDNYRCQQLQIPFGNEQYPYQHMKYLNMTKCEKYELKKAA